MLAGEAQVGDVWIDEDGQSAWEILEVEHDAHLAKFRIRYTGGARDFSVRSFERGVDLQPLVRRGSTPLQ